MTVLFHYVPENVCSSAIHFSVDGGVITHLVFDGGCDGNLRGISRLAVGLTPGEVIALLDGIPCGESSTSCPDQLARALRLWRDNPDLLQQTGVSE